MRLRYRTIAGGSATEGVDYRPHDHPDLVIPPETKTWTVGLLTKDDAIDDNGETVRVEISDARLMDVFDEKIRDLSITKAEATGTISNSDPLPRALLSRFGRTAAVHVVEHVQERIEAPRGPGFEGRFAGHDLRRGLERDLAANFLNQLGATARMNPAGAARGGPVALSPTVGMGSVGTSGFAGGAGQMAITGGPRFGAAGLSSADSMAVTSGLNGGLSGGGLLQRGLGGGDVLTGSSFALNRETRRGGILSVWSRGAQSSFAGREGLLSLGGDVRTTMFGADYAKGPLIAGLSLSHSRGLGEYAGVAGGQVASAGGQVASAVTGLYPWLGYKATDRITVWGGGRVRRWRDAADPGRRAGP